MDLFTDYGSFIHWTTCQRRLIILKWKKTKRRVGEEKELQILTFHRACLYLLVLLIFLPFSGCKFDRKWTCIFGAAILDEWCEVQLINTIIHVTCFHLEPIKKRDTQKCARLIQNDNERMDDTFSTKAYLMETQQCFICALEVQPHSVRVFESIEKNFWDFLQIRKLIYQ